MKLAIATRRGSRTKPAKVRHPGIVLATGVAILLAMSAGFARAQKDTTGKKYESIYEELAKAPKKASARQNPLEHDPDAVAAGGKLFGIHCAECHGAMADGGRKGPSLRSQEVQETSPGTLFWILTNGVVRRGMPVWSKLPEPQRWQLVSYIKSLASPAVSSQNAEASARSSGRDR